MSSLSSPPKVGPKKEPADRFDPNQAVTGRWMIHDSTRHFRVGSWMDGLNRLVLTARKSEMFETS